MSVRYVGKSNKRVDLPRNNVTGNDGWHKTCHIYFNVFLIKSSGGAHPAVLRRRLQMLNVGDYAVTITVETAVCDRFVITYRVKNGGVEDVGIFLVQL